MVEQRNKSSQPTDLDKQFVPDRRSVFTIGFLYFIQGFALALCFSIPLTYKKMPSYEVLGYYSAASLPFSLKFLTAPLIEKFSVLSYGRRKFWVVVGMSWAAVFLYLVSLLMEDKSRQIETASLLFFVVLGISVQDISTDALSVKQLRKPELASLLQSIFQQIGGVTGSLCLVELTSDSTAKYFGFTKAFFSPGEFIRLSLLMIMVPTLLIHLFFKEKRNEKQRVVNELSLWKVFAHYKHFIMPKYRVCRQAIFFLLVFQGMNFFTAGFSIELINNRVIKKEFIVVLNNLALLIIFPSTYAFSRFVSRENLQAVEKRLYLIRLAVYFGIFFVVSPSEKLSGSICLIAMSVLSSLHFYIHGIVMNSFEDSQFEGMSVTMMASMSNLGRNTFLHLEIIDRLGFSSCCWIMTCYSGLHVVLMNREHQWVNAGQEEEKEDSQIAEIKAQLQVEDKKAK